MATKFYSATHGNVMTKAQQMIGKVIAGMTGAFAAHGCRYQPTGDPRGHPQGTGQYDVINSRSILKCFCRTTLRIRGLAPWLDFGRFCSSRNL